MLDLTDQENPRTVACLHCGHPSDPTTLGVCTRCLDRARRMVLDVVDDMARFPSTVLELTGLRSPSFNVARTTTSDDDLRLPFGLDAQVEDPHDTRIAALRRPESATDILRGWAHAWAELRHDELPWSWEQYLVDRTQWAMQHPETSSWSQYADEARAVRTTVRRLLGITPVQAGTPCPDCGGKVVQEWRPRADRTPGLERARWSRRRGTEHEGLDDIARCTRCRRSWSSTAHLAVASMAALTVMPRTRPEALLTFGQLALALEGRVLKPTLKTWIHRGMLRPVHGPWPRAEARARRRHDGTTERLYRFGDADLIAAWDEAYTEDATRDLIALWDAALAEDSSHRVEGSMA
jgi:DNA-directed RNA polymerase subunit RPC12/RpoP